MRIEIEDGLGALRERLEAVSKLYTRMKILWH